MRVYVLLVVCSVVAAGCAGSPLTLPHATLGTVRTNTHTTNIPPTGNHGESGVSAENLGESGVSTGTGTKSSSTTSTGTTSNSGTSGTGATGGTSSTSTSGGTSGGTTANTGGGSSTVTTVPGADNTAAGGVLKEANAGNGAFVDPKTGSVLATSAGTTLLDVSTDAQPALNLIPVMNDDGSLSKLLFSPDTPEVTWSVTSSSGTDAVHYAKVKVVYQSLEYMGVPTPTPTPSPADTGASGAACPTPPPGVSATPPPGWTCVNGQWVGPPQPMPSIKIPIMEAGTPVEKDFAVSDFGWPDTFAPNSSTKLTFSVDRPDTYAFFAKNPDTKRFTVTIGLLGADGNPINDKLGKPLTMQIEVKVE